MFDKTDSIGLYVYPVNSGETDILIKASIKKHFSFNDDTFVQIARTPKGKPYVIAGERIFVSVTHSGEYCIIAVSTENVGVDLQIHDCLKNLTGVDVEKQLSKLSCRFFHQYEQSYISKCTKEHFFDVLCAKESYVKYTGEGIDDNFNVFSVVSPGIEKLSNMWCSNGVCFEKVNFLDNYTLCVCSEEKREIKLLKFLHL